MKQAASIIHKEDGGGGTCGQTTALLPEGLRSKPSETLQWHPFI